MQEYKAAINEYLIQLQLQTICLEKSQRLCALQGSLGLRREA